MPSFSRDFSAAAMLSWSDLPVVRGWRASPSMAAFHAVTSQLGLGQESDSHKAYFLVRKSCVVAGTQHVSAYMG